MTVYNFNTIAKHDNDLVEAGRSAFKRGDKGFAAGIAKIDAEVAALDQMSTARSGAASRQLFFAGAYLAGLDDSEVMTSAHINAVYLKVATVPGLSSSGDDAKDRANQARIAERAAGLSIVRQACGTLDAGELAEMFPGFTPSMLNKEIAVRLGSLSGCKTGVARKGFVLAPNGVEGESVGVLGVIGNMVAGKTWEGEDKATPKSAGKTRGKEDRNPDAAPDHTKELAEKATGLAKDNAIMIAALTNIRDTFEAQTADVLRDVVREELSKLSGLLAK